MAKKTYWMATPDGAKAAVDGADVRDAHAEQGWVECAGPTGNDLVWACNDATGGWAKFPARVLRVWQARGWQPAVPPLAVVDPQAALMAPDNPPPATGPAAVTRGEPSPTTNEKGTDLG